VTTSFRDGYTAVQISLTKLIEQLAASEPTELHEREGQTYRRTTGVFRGVNLKLRRAVRELEKGSGDQVIR
jgi:hypothetical protein